MEKPYSLFRKVSIIIFLKRKDLKIETAKYFKPRSVILMFFLFWKTILFTGKFGLEFITMKIDANEIGARIRRVRDEKNFTQEAFGKLIGVQGAAVSKYEKGDIDPGTASLAKIAEIGGISLDWLVTGKDRPCTHEPQTDEELAAQLIARPKVRDLAIQQARELISEENQSYGDPAERELLRIYRRLPDDDKLHLVKTAKGLEAVNESRRNEEGDSRSTEQKSA